MCNLYIAICNLSSRIVTSRNSLKINELHGEWPRLPDFGRKFLLRFSEGLQIDAELLALLVQVAAFQAERAGDVRHVKIVAPDFGKQDLALEGLSALYQRSLT